MLPTTLIIVSNKLLYHAAVTTEVQQYHIAVTHACGTCGVECSTRGTRVADLKTIVSLIGSCSLGTESFGNGLHSYTTHSLFFTDWKASTQRCNAATRNLFRRRCFLPSLPILSPLFSRLEMGLQIQLRDLGNAVSSPAEENGTTFAATTDTFPGLYANPGREHIFGVFRAQGTCLVAANVVLFLLNEI